MFNEDSLIAAWNAVTDGSSVSDAGFDCPGSPLLPELSPETASSLLSMMSEQNSPEISASPEPAGSTEENPPLEAREGVFKAKMVLVTWSQANSLTKDLILSHLETMTTKTNPLLRALVGKENHANGGIHFHAVVEWKTSRTMRPTAFKVGGIHPNVTTHRQGRGSYADSLMRAWNYASKEDPEPLIFGEPPEEKTEKMSKRHRDFLEAQRLAETEGVEPALKFLRKEQPFEAIMRYDSARRGLEAARRASTSVETPARPLSAYRYLPFLPDDWKTLYLWGPSGLGKTALARSLLPGARLVRHRNQLVGADTSAGLIFDDFDVSHWPPTSVIHLVDWEETSGIDVKHGHVEIPPQTRKIFTMNVPLEDWIPEGAKEYQREAIRRRMSVIHIIERLY